MFSFFTIFLLKHLITRKTKIIVQGIVKMLKKYVFRIKVHLINEDLQVQTLNFHYRFINNT